MSSPKFERVKRSNPSLSGFLDRLVAYILAQIRSGQRFIIPKLAAARLGMNDGEAFVLLELLARGFVLRRVYNLYCNKTGVLLATVDDASVLDEIPHCDDCDADHDKSELRVEIAFIVVNGDLQEVAAQ
jgi:hypothetical protein